MSERFLPCSLSFYQVAKMIEHIQQLRGESHADALANAKACGECVLCL